VIIPPVLQHEVMEMLHDTYPGINRMKASARSYLWWPNMDGQLEELVTNCGTCQIPHAARCGGQYFPWSWPNRRWQSVFFFFLLCSFQRTRIVDVTGWEFQVARSAGSN
jgi:hypothetical protein